MDPTTQTIAENINRRMLELNYSCGTLAKALDTTDEEAHAIRHGTVALFITELHLVAQWLGTTPEQLATPATNKEGIT